MKCRRACAHVEVDLGDIWEEILYSLMSGVFSFCDGFDKCILIDSRTYPAEWVEVGKRQGTQRIQGWFCGNYRLNTALIRRSNPFHRSGDGRMHAESFSKQISFSGYMDNRADHAFLENQDKIKISSRWMPSDNESGKPGGMSLRTGDGITPFPKFKFTERPGYGICVFWAATLLFLLIILLPY